MARVVTFDIETRNWFEEVSSNEPAALDLALIAIHDSEDGSYSSYLQEELVSLWPILEKADTLVGFNSDHFDIPILNKYYAGDLTQIRSIDLMKEVTKVLGRRLSLNNLAKATLGRGKIAEGAEATDWWKEGKIEKIREYCIDDVRLTRKLYDYALQNGHWKYNDGPEIFEISIDTNDWKDGSDHSMTHSLGF